MILFIIISEDHLRYSLVYLRNVIYSFRPKIEVKICQHKLMYLIQILNQIH